MNILLLLFFILLLRFAKFISGEDHLSTEELEQHEDTTEFSPLEQHNTANNIRTMNFDYSNSEMEDSELEDFSQMR